METREKLSWQIVYTVVFLILLQVGLALGTGIFAGIPEPLEAMFNESFTRHYGSYLTEIGESTIWSAGTIATRGGEIFAILFLLPLIDKMGRKFAAVYLKYTIAVSCSSFTLLAYFLPSFEAYIVASFITGAFLQIRISTLVLYLSECSPTRIRGFVSLLGTFGNVIGGLVALTLARPSLLGNEDNWYILALGSLLICSIAMIFLYWVPESPHHLIFKGNYVAAEKSLRFFHGNSARTEALTSSIKRELSWKSDQNNQVGFLKLIRNESFRKTLILFICMTLIQDASPLAIEFSFFVKLHTLLGFSTETVLSIGSLQRVVTMPLFFLSSIAVEKIGRKPLAMAAILILYLKAAILALATSLAFYLGPSTFTIILGVVSDLTSSIFNCLSYPAICNLLICELTPPNSKVSAIQITSIVAAIISTVFSILVPYALNFFMPLPYFLLLLSQPVLILYVFRNLPETAGRENADIVHDFEEAVKSRMSFVIFFHVLAFILFGILCATAYLSYLVRHSNKRANRSKETVSVMSVLGSGGHTTEMIELMKHLDSDVYNTRTYVVAETDSMSEGKVNDFENSRNCTGYRIERIPRSREVGQSYVSSVVSTAYATYFSLLIVWKNKPDLLLVNGPGTCIPIAFMVALLDMVRLVDTCIIYEESICRVQSLSLSGAILYYAGLADEVIVQWKSLQLKYPRTRFVDTLSE